MTLNDELTALTTLFTGLMLASQNTALASPTECEHKILLGVNKEQVVCGVCRTILPRTNESTVFIKT